MLRELEARLPPAPSSGTSSRVAVGSSSKRGGGGGVRAKARLSAFDSALAELDAIDVGQQPEQLGGAEGERPPIPAAARVRHARAGSTVPLRNRPMLFVHHIILGRVHSARLPVDLGALEAAYAGRDPREVCWSARTRGRLS
jgi:hypothetical protein